MTLADKIRELVAKHPDLSTTDIANMVDTSVTYVRVVARQRMTGPSRADIRYKKTAKGLLKQRGDCVARCAFVKALARSANEKAVRAAVAKARRKAAEMGMNRLQANSLAARVSGRVRRETGDLDAALKAGRDARDKLTNGDTNAKRSNRRHRSAEAKSSRIPTAG